jgi:acyl-CoA thioester hydrolase
LDLLESARGEFFRQLGKPLAQLQEADVIFPVVEALLKYHSPARYDNLLEIKLSIARLDGIRLGFTCQVFKEPGILVLDAETLHLSAHVSGKPRRIPKDLHLLLAQLVWPK